MRKTVNYRSIPHLPLPKGETLIDPSEKELIIEK